MHKHAVIPEIGALVSKWRPGDRLALIRCGPWMRIVLIHDSSQDDVTAEAAQICNLYLSPVGATVADNEYFIIVKLVAVLPPLSGIILRDVPEKQPESQPSRPAWGLLDRCYVWLIRWFM